MRDAVIVDAVRTPVGKRNGSLAEVHPADLSAVVLQALVDRTKLDPALVDDVVWGCVSQAGEQTFDIARTAVLSAGWPDTVPGTTVDRQCGSSQQAIHFAAAGVISGQYDVAVAGGVESMSRVPMGSAMTWAEGQTPIGPRYAERYGPDFPSQGLGAEQIAAKWGLDRLRLDEFAARSHANLAEAIDDGRFESQIAPVDLPDGSRFEVDEGLRRGSSTEALAALKPAFREDGTLTAGNSSQISDGAAALLLMTSEKAKRLGMTPIARIHTACLAGADPDIMLTAPIPATAKLVEKSGVPISEIGVFEVNEAFASVPLAWLAESGADGAKLNPNGGAIAIGHPLGGSGARLMTTMVHDMRNRGIRYGLQTMCEGGGQANATLVELISG